MAMLRASSALVLLLPVALAVAPPGQLFNLTGWELQLPVSNGKGGVVEISQPALATYTSEYFYTNVTDNSMTFWAAVNGAHTSGSSYPRSELRELLDFNYSGTHVLNVSMRVLEVPTNGKITIGQAHFDGVSGDCSIFCELEWQSGTVVSHVRDQSCNNVNMVLPGTPFALGEHFSYTIRVNGNVLSVSTSRGAVAPYTYSWPEAYPMYFKAGDYVQQAGTSATIGGRTSISSLSTSHSPAESAWPVAATAPSLE